jgi:hypothetical protein
MSKDPTTELQQAYYTLLSDALAVNVYDEAPADATYPHVQFGDTTLTDSSTKSEFIDEATFSLSVVDRYALDSGTRTYINAIVNTIKQTLRDRTDVFDMSNFDVIYTVVDNDIFRKEFSETYTYWIREIRFRHKIEEK